MIAAVGLLAASCGTGDETADTSGQGDAVDSAPATTSTDVASAPDTTDAPAPTEPADAETVDATPIALDEVAQIAITTDATFTDPQVNNDTEGTFEVAEGSDAFGCSGPSPVDCVFWLGDEKFGRRVAVSLEGDQAWFGPFEGPWETEIEFDFPRQLLSRNFSGTGWSSSSSTRGAWSWPTRRRANPSVNRSSAASKTDAARRPTRSTPASEQSDRNACLRPLDATVG